MKHLAAVLYFLAMTYQHRLDNHRSRFWVTDLSKSQYESSNLYPTTL